MSAPTTPGDTHGPIVPQHTSHVRVEREELSFILAPDLKRAQVQASYFLANDVERRRLGTT